MTWTIIAFAISVAGYLFSGALVALHGDARSGTRRIGLGVLMAAAALAVALGLFIPGMAIAVLVLIAGWRHR